MGVCRAGHPTSTPDWCEVCGRPVDGPRDPATCRACGAERPGRFCDECGTDASVPLWWARVDRDPAWFEHVYSGRADRPSLPPSPSPSPLPSPPGPRRVRLDHDHMVVGRRGRRNPAAGVDIDVADDPGVSARHAVLLGTGDGGWAVADLHSSNGTAVAPGFEPVPPGVPVPVPTGGWVRIGAWTAIHLEPG